MPRKAPSAPFASLRVSRAVYEHLTVLRQVLGLRTLQATTEALITEKVQVLRAAEPLLNERFTRETNHA